jgi:signal transduction histidine kinase
MTPLTTLLRRSPRRTVLYVDDDAIDRDSVARAIAQRGLPIDLVTADSVDQGRQSLETLDVELAIVDQRVGAGNGIDLLQVAPGIPKILLTGSGSEELAARALRGGACDYITKRVDGRHLELLLPSVMATLARRDADHAARRGSEELARSHRELEHFAATVVEALSGPLASVVELAREASAAAREGRPAAAEAGEQLESQARRAQSFIGGLARYAALRSGSEALTHNELTEVVRHAAARVEARYPGRLHLGAVSGGAVHARPNQLRAALEAILENAVEHGAAPGEPVRVCVDLHCDDQGWTDISVCDDGPGLEIASRSEVFLVFRALGPTAGAGIGLAVVRRVAQIHRGRAWIDDSAGGGVCVHLELPGPEA